MSLVSHDSIWECHNGVTYEQKDETIEKKKAKDRGPERDASKETENNNTFYDELNKNNHDNISITKINDATNKKIKKRNGTNFDNLLEKHSFDAKELRIFKNKIRDLEARKRTRKNTNNTEYLNNTRDKGWNKIKIYENSVVNNIDIEINEQIHFNKQMIKKDRFQKTFTNRSPVRYTVKNCAKNKTWQKKNKHQFWMQNSVSNSLARINEKHKRQSRWRINSGVLISLVMLNVAGLSTAVDSSTFSSALTSRMIASFLGYPSTCSLGSEVRPCTLTLTCWLRGGTRLRGCGGWLFTCCGLPEPTRETFDKSIPSSEWKYKPPSKLHQVPQRSVMPNNVFRRRVDDDVTQMDCGLPSSRILQKRIIGGREARFAEFPWQAHVRISEFQCGGVLVSRRYVATAAHCVSRAHTRDIAVWLGAIDTSATHHPARKLGVIQKILHPLFQFRMTQPDRYDIALLKLSRLITYMSHILPICLPDHDMDLRGRSGVIAGWGKTDASNSHTGTNLLRSATVPILSKEQCINWHQSKQISVEIHSEMICAGHSDGHQDACLGDSGGPLIVMDSGRYYLVGITSAGFGCGVDHQPGIYHNVKLTANWIRSIISPAVNFNDNYLN